MDDCNFDEKSLSKWQQLQHRKFITKTSGKQRWVNNLVLATLVWSKRQVEFGDTTK